MAITPVLSVAKEFPSCFESYTEFFAVLIFLFIIAQFLSEPSLL
jgi:hypothetical protein